MNVRTVQGKATFRGHPLHLMFVSFPVALWTVPLLTDAAGAITHDAFWFRMSVVLIAFGTIGGVFASAFGYIDYATCAMPRAVRRVGTRHMLASFAALGVFAVAWLLRAHDYASPSGIAVTVFGDAALLLGGYFGSALTQLGVGVPGVAAVTDTARAD